MAHNKQRPRFKITLRNIDTGGIDEEVQLVQRFLRRFGYLNEEYEAKRFDQPTQDALKLYQARAGIKVTGSIDQSTAESMEEPRCGVPDFPRSARFFGMSDSFATRGCVLKEISDPLKYSIARPPPFFSLSDISPAIEAAFNTWAQVTPLRFQRASSSEAPRLTLKWVDREHGDGEDFDGIGRVVAHAFLPLPCGGSNAGECHFDNDERWGVSGSAVVRDIQTVALHEIGHLIGLDHSLDERSVMFQKQRGVHRDLTQPDIDAIRALYP